MRWKSNVTNHVGIFSRRDAATVATGLYVVATFLHRSDVTYIYSETALCNRGKTEFLLFIPKYLSGEYNQNYS